MKVQPDKLSSPNYRQFITQVHDRVRRSRVMKVSVECFDR